MAIATVCTSSPTCSPTLPTISPPLLKTHQPLQSIPFKFDLNLVSSDALTIAPTAEAVSTASPALEAARDAAMAGENEVKWNWTYGLEARRKRRRKRRRGLEGRENGEVVEVPLILSVKPGRFTRKQEAELCMMIQEGARLEVERRRMAEACMHEPSLKQLASATGMSMRRIDNILCNARKSKEIIIQAYRGLVSSIATGYQGRGLSLPELIQEGSMGLLRGAAKYDPKRGCKLSTYAYWWIRQAITRSLANQSRLIRLPENVLSMLAKITEAKNILSNRLRRSPSDDEIAEFLDMQVSTVRLIIERSTPPISLDKVVVTDNGPLKLQDIISGPDEWNPEAILKKQLIKQEVEKLLNTLSERESRILRLHYGLDGITPKSCEEIGIMFNLSRERIRQINASALTKLRQTSIADELKLLYFS
uniref:Sigma factor n=1 Tax=Pelargonium dichondrifolium TaxID=73194 RepID=A0A0G2STU1_9ROSI|nr:sigma factor [Pelargonium dichondrifolium]